MLTLRDFRTDDAERLVELANNEQVSRYLVDTFPWPYTRRDAVWWIETGSQEQGVVNKVIEVKGRLAGTIGLKLQSGWRSHLAEVGYWLGRSYWGNGLATTALAQMSERAFVELAIHKLYAPVLAPNAASMRVLQKCGFRLAGVLKDEVVKHGRFFDVHLFERRNASASSYAQPFRKSL